MAAFPISVDPSERTRIIPDSGKRNFTTQGGGTRGTTHFDKTYYKITMVDQYLSAADVTLITDQFDNFSDDEHTRTIDGQAFTFRYLNRPRVIAYHGDSRTVQSNCRGF